MSRPPDYALYNGACFAHTTPWVGLNDGGRHQLIYAAPTDGDCNFNIPGVPDGNYQLVIWDSALDLIIASTAINIAGGQCNTPSGSCALGDVPVFQWFHRQEHWVFNDYNANGMWEPDGTDGTPGTIDDEGPLPDVPLNIRWRDGTIYQTNVTDVEGAFAFDEVFPFFSLAGGRDRLHPAPGDRRDGHRGQRRADPAHSRTAPDNDMTFGGQLNPQDQTQSERIRPAWHPTALPMREQQLPRRDGPRAARGLPGLHRPDQHLPVGQAPLPRTARTAASPASSSTT